MLGFNLHCDESSQTNNNDDNHGGGSSSSSNHDIIDLLPIVTTHTFHREVNDCVDDSHYYLFTLRDPVARILFHGPGEGKGHNHKKCRHVLSMEGCIR